MKFTVKDVPELPFKTSIPGLILSVPGNVYESDEYPDLSDAELDAIYRAGFIEIEGRDPSPATNKDRPVRIKPDPVKIKTEVQHG